MQSIYKNAFILLFSKEDKTKQHVTIMKELANNLTTEMGIHESVTSVPVHCDSGLESETWLVQPIQNDPAQINVEVESLLCCENSDLQEAIRQSLLKNVELPGVNSPSATKRKSEELTPDSPTPGTHMPHALDSPSINSYQHQPCPPPVQSATEYPVETATDDDDELPDPGYVPIRARKRNLSINMSDCGHGINEMEGGFILPSDNIPLATVNTGEPVENQVVYHLNENESDFIRLVEEIAFITAVPAKDRTADQKKRLRNLKIKQKKLEKDFQHLNAVMAPKSKTASERKASERAKKDQQSKEAEKMADRQRKATDAAREAARQRNATDVAKEAARQRNATDVAREATRQRMATDVARAADCTRKANRKLKSKVNTNDGLRCNEVLDGTMLVPDLSDSSDSIGKMDHVCQFCHALKLKNETPNLCCNSGRLVMSPFPRPPQEFMTLYRPETREDIARSKVFKKYIRPLNNALCLSSLKTNYRALTNYNPTVIIQGQVHQYAGPLQARDGETPVFAQLYVQDPSLETTTWFANLTVPSGITEWEKHVLKSILLTLQDALKICNPYVRDFHQIINIPDEQLGSARLVISAKARPQGQHE